MISLYRIPLRRLRRLSHFRGTGDAGYKATVNHMLDSLLIKAVSGKKYKELQLSLMKASTRILSSTDERKLSDIKDEWRLPLLHLAVMAPNDDAVNMLLGNGVSPQSRDQYGQTALHRAVKLFYDLDNAPSGVSRDEKQDCLTRIISQLLLFTKKAELNNSRDRQGLTVREALEKMPKCDCPTSPCKHDAIRVLLDNHQPRVTRRADEPKEEPWEGWRPPYPGTPQYDACRQAKAVVGEFYKTADGPPSDYEMPSIWDLIYEKGNGPVRLLSKVTDRIHASSVHQGKPDVCCRWIHLPANNVGG